MNTKISLSFLTVFSFMLLCSFTPVQHNRVQVLSVTKQKAAPFTCAAPTKLRSSPQMWYSSVSWATPYIATCEFECYYSGDTPGSRQYLVASETVYTNGLFFNTELPGYYDWQVRMSCPNDTYGEWATASFYVATDSFE